MATYKLVFDNNQLGDFNTTNITHSGGGFNFAGEQELTINENHPADRLIESGAISSRDDVTGWRLTVIGDEGLNDEGNPDDTGNDVTPGAPVGVEYSTDGGQTWNSYTTDIGAPDAVYYARQDETTWMSLTANIPGEGDGQFGFIVSDAPVAEGQKFVADETVAETQTGEYALPCFTASTLITTETGPVAAIDLAVGDMVLTSDDGLQAVRWKGSRTVTKAELAADPKLRPIRIRAGALGPLTPTQDLLVSPQHRIMVRSQIAQRMFGTDEVLVAAKQLCGIEGIDVVEEFEDVTYVHILFDAHQIIYSNGAWTESLYTGPEALKAVGPAAVNEIYTLFPELKNGVPHTAARPILQGRVARSMASRHAKNAKPLAA